MTDSQKNVSEKTPKEVFLTKPLPPSRVKIVESSDQVTLGIDFEGVGYLKAQHVEYEKHHPGQINRE